MEKITHFAFSSHTPILKFAVIVILSEVDTASIKKQTL